MSRERAERLARALGVTVEVVQPTKRHRHRIMVNGVERDSEWGDDAAWREAERLMETRARGLCRDLFAPSVAAERSACRAHETRKTAERLEQELATAREAAEAAERERATARRQIDAALALATPEARAAFAALTEAT